MIENNLLVKSFKDFWTKPILKIAFVPFILSMIVMYALFFWAADAGLDAFQETYVQIEQQEQTIAPDGTSHTQSQSVELEGGDAILSFLLKHSITSWLLSFIVYTLGSFFVLLLSIIVALFIIGFLTPHILAVIRDRHYSECQIEGFDHIGPMLLFFVKTFAIMILLLIVLMPFYFIPLLNIIAFNLPFYYLFHKLLVYDVASTICTKEEYKKIMYFKGNAIRMKTLMLYIASLVPFVALFGSVFFVIYLGHTFFTEVLKLRHEKEVASTSLSEALSEA
ncbi:MAG: EI24 domain-containing protein [Sulfurimonadaceae bacterium]|nr:EI24 domain-containing protein [Sulfurimonadaceae bacterium]